MSGLGLLAIAALLFFGSAPWWPVPKKQPPRDDDIPTLSEMNN